VDLKEMMKKSGPARPGSEYEQEGSSRINMAVDLVASIKYT